MPRSKNSTSSSRASRAINPRRWSRKPGGAADQRQNQAVAKVTETSAQYDQLIADKETEVAETRAKERRSTPSSASGWVKEESGNHKYWGHSVRCIRLLRLAGTATMIGEIMEYDNAVMDQLAAT